MLNTSDQANRVNICAVEIDNISFDNALRDILDLVKKPGFSYVVTPNVDHIVRMRRDPEFRVIYKKAALVLPDGMPLLWAGKFLGTPLKAKISGSDLFPRLCELTARKGYRVFFLGGSEGAALRAADELRKKTPNLCVVGVYSPPFGFEKSEVETEKIIQLIDQAHPDILFVGLGSPKQERFIFRFKDRFKVPVSIGIGVSFEFIAGMVRRAPFWMQYAGLEWFWRLLMEPMRLWKRYLFDDPVFFLLVLKQKLGLK